MLRSPILIGGGPWRVSVLPETPQYSAASARLRPRLGMLGGSPLISLVPPRCVVPASGPINAFAIGALAAFRGAESHILRHRASSSNFPHSRQCFSSRFFQANKNALVRCHRVTRQATQQNFWSGRACRGSGFRQFSQWRVFTLRLIVTGFGVNMLFCRTISSARGARRARSRAGETTPLKQAVEVASVYR